MMLRMEPCILYSLYLLAYLLLTVCTVPFLSEKVTS